MSFNRANTRWGVICQSVCTSRPSRLEDAVSFVSQRSPRASSFLPTPIVLPPPAVPSGIKLITTLLRNNLFLSLCLFCDCRAQVLGLFTSQRSKSRLLAAVFHGLQLFSLKRQIEGINHLVFSLRNTHLVSPLLATKKGGRDESGKFEISNNLRRVSLIHCPQPDY